MKKNVVVTLIALAVVGTSIVLCLQFKKNPALTKAVACERAGDLQTALSYYTEAATVLAPSMQMPDVNRSKFLEPEVLKKEIMSYTSWLWVAASKATPRAVSAIDGIKRCMQHGKSDVIFMEPKVVAFTEEKYASAWNATFFAPGVKIDPSQAALSSGNFARNLSLVVVECEKDYSYEIYLLNTANGRTTKCFLPSENSVRLYAVPGEHLLIVRSVVTFSSGEIWRSAFAPLLLTIPEKTSQIQLELRTSVHRQK